MLHITNVEKKLLELSKLFSSKQYTIINISYNFTKLNSGQVLKISRESQPLTHFSFVCIINLLNGLCMKLCSMKFTTTIIL